MLSRNHLILMVVVGTTLYFHVDIAEATTHPKVSIDDCATLGDKETDLQCLVYVPGANDVGDCDINSPTSPPDPCDSDPCRYNAVCTNKGTDFECKCPYPMGGKTCEDLICEQCIRDGDLVIFINKTTILNWVDSYAYCANLGMTLFMDKSPRVHGFAYGLLIQEITDRKADVYFNIGLNRTSADAPWTFVDGTLLDAAVYQSWAYNRPEKSLCVVLINSALWKWDDESCTDIGSKAFHPICEKRYPFLSH